MNCPSPALAAPDGASPCPDTSGCQHHIAPLPNKPLCASQAQEGPQRSLQSPWVSIHRTQSSLDPETLPAPLPG